MEENKTSGKYGVLTGPMKSGKTARLLEIAHSALESGVEVSIFKPETDTRDDEIVSRNGQKMACTKVHPVLGANTIRFYVYQKDPHVVILDEAQFFASIDFVHLTNQLVLDGYDVYIAGLEQTSERLPFGHLKDWMIYAKDVEKLKGECECCHNDQATLTYANFIKGDSIVIESEGAPYLCVCDQCWHHLTETTTKTSKNVTESASKSYINK